MSIAVNVISCALRSATIVFAVVADALRDDAAQQLDGAGVRGRAPRSAGRATAPGKHTTLIQSATAGLTTPPSDTRPSWVSSAF